MDEKKELSYYDMIQEGGKVFVETDDPQLKEATAKGIYHISKANIEDDEAAKRLELEERRVAAQEEANRLKQIELEQQDRKDEQDADLKQQQMAQEDKDSKRRLAGQIFVGVVAFLGVVVNLAGADHFADHLAGIQENGTLINMNKNLIPSFFTNNKPKM